MSWTRQLLGYFYRVSSRKCDSRDLHIIPQFSRSQVVKRASSSWLEALGPASKSHYKSILRACATRWAVAQKRENLFLRSKFINLVCQVYHC